MKSILVCIAAAGLAAAAPAAPVKPEIEFRVLLVIKRVSDTYSPLFLPVRAQMTDAEVAQARRCFEVETPAMVDEITGGKVRFTPAVLVSDKPLRLFNPKRSDSAEYEPQELLNEVFATRKPGDFDSVGCYFLHYDSASGYRIPRAGFGVGGCDAARALGLFAVNCTPQLNPRDEVFLHEWMHGLDGFYGNKAGVRIPKGWLHGCKDYGYTEKPWHPGDTFRGWMEWYRDYLNGNVRDGDQRAGLGSAAWKYGPMRTEALNKAEAYRPVQLSVGTYPGWVYALMKGDLAHAALGPALLETRLEPGALSKASAWSFETWNPKAGSQARITATEGGALMIENPAPNNTSLTRTVALEPFKNYLFSAEVRTEGVAITEKDGRFGVNLYAGSSVSPRLLTGTQPWTSVSLPFTTGAKAESCRLKLAVGGFASVARGRAFFRNVQVRKIGYPAEDAKTPSVRK